MKIESLQSLFTEQLKDVLSAEKQIIAALPKMAAAASDTALKDAFKQHLEQTREHVVRLEKVFDTIDESPRSKKCKGMAGLIEEGKEVIEETEEPDARDAGLIAAAQRVEHYEIAAYGCLRAYADQLGYHDASRLLQETLDEEGETDKLLTRLAESSINPAANHEARA